jgi:hypothetical protein
MLDGVPNPVPGMARMAHDAYDKPPLLKAGDTPFTSREGAQQGCQLSMIMCCVAEHPAVE